MKEPRGSYWKKCDFHIHTPFSALSNNFGADFDNYVKTLFQKAIEKGVSVIGITDYFTIDGYKKIKLEYLNNPQKLATLFTTEEIAKIKQMMVLPNIEFRLNKIVQINKYKDGIKVSTENGRINFHVLFSNNLPIDLIEESFLHDLEFIYEADPNEPDKRKKLKTDNLIKLGERLKEEQPNLNGSALQIGMTNAVVDDEQITKILTSNNDFKDGYIIVIPADEDLSKISWNSQDHLTRKILLSRANAFFTSNSNTIKFGLGEKSTTIDDFIKEFKSIKPCIWGSDAHDFEKLFEPDLQKYCWIKADTTFDGIRQILFEPRDRVFIGDYPELFTRIKSAKGNYINSLNIVKSSTYNNEKGVWFNNFELLLGYELVAIIGNKGKGKSAIADIIALLGNSHIRRQDFSFLNNDKFCQKGYAENFIGTLKWWDGTQNQKKLNESNDATSIERVKYIPQAYLEKLCNDENSGFQEEINKVVFSRLEETDKLGKRSFFELEKHKAETINQQISVISNKISELNNLILDLQKRSLGEYKTRINNKKELKEKELENHKKEKENITQVPNPENDPSLSTEQKKKAEKISSLGLEISKLETSIAEKTSSLSAYNIKLSELENIEKEITLQGQNFAQWKQSKNELFSKYDLNIDNIISISINVETLQSLIASTTDQIEIIRSLVNTDSSTWDESKNLIYKREKLTLQKQQLEKELEKPFKEYQEYVAKLKEWDIKEQSIIGDESKDDTIKFYQYELNYIENTLPLELVGRIEQRTVLTLDIFEQKREIQAIYNKIKESISNVLKEYSEEQNITIETAFKVDKKFYTQFFDYVNRYGLFYSNSDEELRKFVAKYNFDDPEQIRLFLADIETIDIRFKENRIVDFYNYICTLNYLNPEYDLRLNSKSLTQLSPGEKGGLLLVFYLVLDRDNKPLIIDQPEDNLDNQSVAEILVPYIKRAKKLRQIIMVTHNPNLAIVSDAEQIIYMDIDKENNYLVSYDSGGIENPSINNHIVDILEGKMKAFDNRRTKYKK